MNVGLFALAFAKRLLAYWAAKLLSPEAVTEVLIVIFESHVKRSDTKSDDKLLNTVKKYLGEDSAIQ